MKIIFFGSSEFAKVVLEQFLSNKRVPTLIVTTPDKPKGRGLKMMPTPVKEFAVGHSIEVIAPVSLNSQNTIKELRGADSDIFVIVSYGKIIPKSLLGIPKVMPIALHPSLLPLYRGAAPINWTVINGEKETGASVFKVNERVDSGEIILQEKIPIEDSDDVLTLFSKLAELGSRALLKALDSIENKKFTLMPQDDSKASLAPKLRKEDGKIDWNKDAQSIRNQIRGLRGWPESHTYYKDTMLKILEVQTQEGSPSAKPSTIVELSRDGIYVATGRGVLKIKKLKPQGKKEMDVQAFLCGYKLKIGEKFL